MKHNDIKLTLARHDQSTNSSAPYGDFLQLIGSCFKQGKSEIGGKIKCSQTWTSMNHHMESQLALQHVHNIQNSHRRRKRNITSTVGAIHKKTAKKTTKGPTSSFHLTNKTSVRTELDNNGRMRLTWHAKQQKKRQGKYSQVLIRETTKPDGTYIDIVNSFHLQHSSVWKGVAGGAIENHHQSWWDVHSNHWSCLFWWKLYCKTMALAFPFAFLAFWSAFLLSARSFFQHHSGNSSSLGWKYQRAEARPSKKGNANQYMDLEDEEEKKKKKKKNVMCQKKKGGPSVFQYLKCLLSQTQRSHGSGLYSALCTWDIPRTHNMSMQQSPTLVIFFLMSSSTSTFAASCSFACHPASKSISSFSHRLMTLPLFHPSPLFLVISCLMASIEEPQLMTKLFLLDPWFHQLGSHSVAKGSAFLRQGCSSGRDLYKTLHFHVPPLKKLFHFHG